MESVHKSHRLHPGELQSGRHASCAVTEAVVAEPTELAGQRFLATLLLLGLKGRNAEAQGGDSPWRGAALGRQPIPQQNEALKGRDTNGVGKAIAPFQG